MKNVKCIKQFLVADLLPLSGPISLSPFRSLPCDQGTPALSGSSIAADLLKGTITKLPTEDLSSPEKAREQLAKGHVIYEGKSGHILSYDGKAKAC